MEQLYNKLHLFGAVCLIVYSVIGVVFIYKWWDILSLLETKINFLFQQENERFLKSIGKTPKYHPNAPDTIYAKKVLSGEIDPRKVSLLDFYKNAVFVPGSESEPTTLDKSFFEKGEDQVLPGSPPEDTIMVDEDLRKRFTKKRVTENTTTTETRND